MTDAESRLARLEERVNDMEGWCSSQRDLPVRVALNARAIENYNGDIKRMAKSLGDLHDCVSEWRGSIKVIKWALGGVGLAALAQLVLGTLGL